MRGRRGRGGWRPARRTVLAALALAALAVCVPVGSAVSSKGPAPAGRAVRLAAVGDSITEADARTPADHRLVPGRTGRSWVTTAARDGVVLAGGWAHRGATAADMAAGVNPVRADVLVVLAGTNDTRHGVPFDRTALSLQQIVATAGVPRVVLSAVPPRDAAPDAAADLDEHLRALAAHEGWTFTDPMTGIRVGDHYAPGMTRDGVHPTRRAAAVIGAALHRAVLRAAAA